MGSRTVHAVIASVAASIALAASAQAQPVPAARALITEETRILETYPFSDPNPVPFLTRDERLYPYHSFEGYAHDSEPREWTVVKLENEHIEVFVLPEVGGKVWGAVVKSTGHEFIYRNEVMKFRNIALRGPWTSGGIEFNFGVIGHTPATATPVDYATRENADGSASVFVGGMDLPSRTAWRVEIRLPADRAYFETRVLWHNPTPLEQPYYNWMTAAAFAQDDLVLAVPGNAYLEHPGGRRDWPVDPAGRNLAAYDANRFGGNKSYHVVGELNDFFGGYYAQGGYGFGHWARYEEMPGQKIWLWALSRQGGIWEDLLTDTDGQYVEFQAGRLFVQYSPTGDVNPISQAGFDPGATDRWTETWFPVEGLGGLSDASREGAMHVTRSGDEVTVLAHAFGPATARLRVSAEGAPVEEWRLDLETLEVVERSVAVPERRHIVVEIPELGLRYATDPADDALGRPFVTDPDALPALPEVHRLVLDAEQLVRGRELSRARPLFEAALAREPWNRDALLGLADLEYRRGRWEAGLTHADRALQLDAYDPTANFAAGTLFRAAGRDNDAVEAFGWAARSTAFRSAAYTQLAELMLRRGDPSEALHYARLGTDYDRHNLSALQVTALAARKSGDAALAQSVGEHLLDLDPLHHFVAAERYVTGPSSSAGSSLLDQLRGEYPEQEALELAIGYARRGAIDDAIMLLDLARSRFANPLLAAWAAWLTEDPSALPEEADPSFVFPYRTETLPVLEWVAEHRPHWSWRYLLALNLWGRDRAAEARVLLSALGDEPDYAPAYVSRAHLTVRSPDAERDLRRAVDLDPSSRLLRLELVQHLQRAGQWDDALEASAAGRRDLPADFNLDLLHVASLVELGRHSDAIPILERVRVLPSEHSGTSRTLYEQAHLLAALDALEGGDRPTAARHAEAAREWPEHLGQGRPYDPDERLALFVLGVATGGDEPLEAMVGASAGRVTDRRSLLTIPALVALGRDHELSTLDSDADTPEAAFGRGLIAAVRSGERPAEAARRLGARAEALFEDAEGRLVLRALTVLR